MSEYCHYSTEEIIYCNECGEPITLKETMIYVEIRTRHNMGDSIFFGSRLYHKRCVPEFMKLSGFSWEAEKK